MTETFLERRLRDVGGRITPQRRLIAGIFQEQGGHLSADEIHGLAQRRHPRLSLATVYRTLRWMTECGLVHELRLNGERYRYEIGRDEAHQHMVCLDCGRVIEFICGHCPDIHGDLADKYDFHITGARVRLLGYCADCRARAYNGTK